MFRSFEQHQTRSASRHQQMPLLILLAWDIPSPWAAFFERAAPVGLEVGVPRCCDPEVSSRKSEPLCIRGFDYYSRTTRSRSQFTSHRTVGKVNSISRWSASAFRTCPGAPWFHTKAPGLGVFAPLLQISDPCESSASTSRECEWRVRIQPAILHTLDAPILTTEVFHGADARMAQ